MSNGVVIPNKCKYNSLRQQMCLMLLFFLYIPETKNINMHLTDN